MNRQTLKEQFPLISRTRKCINKYGIKSKWIADKTDIPNKYLSAFLNGKLILSKNQFDVLNDFLNEYEKRMVGFLAIETD